MRTWKGLNTSNLLSNIGVFRGNWGLNPPLIEKDPPNVLRLSELKKYFTL